MQNTLGREEHRDHKDKQAITKEKNTPRFMWKTRNGENHRSEEVSLSNKNQE